MKLINGIDGHPITIPSNIKTSIQLRNILNSSSVHQLIIQSNTR